MQKRVLAVPFESFEKIKRLLQAKDLLRLHKDDKGRLIVEKSDYIAVYISEAKGHVLIEGKLPSFPNGMHIGVMLVMIVLFKIIGIPGGLVIGILLGSLVTYLFYAKKISAFAKEVSEILEDV